jgi:hypothetical protein
MEALNFSPKVCNWIMLYKNQKASLAPKVLKLASPLPNGKPYISAKKPIDLVSFSLLKNKH